MVDLGRSQFKQTETAWETSLEQNPPNVIDTQNSVMVYMIAMEIPGVKQTIVKSFSQVDRSVIALL